MTTKLTIPNAPGLRLRLRASGETVAYWIARQDIVKRGYPDKAARLWSGRDLTETRQRLIQDECARLQAKMLAWAQAASAPAGFDGSLRGLIAAYQRDPDGPYAALRPHTRRSYDWDLAIIEKNVGGLMLAAITGKDFQAWHRRWSAPVLPPKGNGRPRIRRAHGLMTMLRMLFNYGVATEIDRPAAHCVRLSLIMSKQRFANIGRRSMVLTAAHAEAICAQAVEMGLPSIALAQALQFDLALRQKDVIGEWVALEAPGLSAVTDRGQKWVVGLRWEEVDANMILAHPLSKSNGRKVGEYDLRLYPMVMAALGRMDARPASGPMVVCEGTDLPYRTRHFATVWREVADAAGVPREVTNMDSRAGATTETLTATGGDMEAARKQAGHSDVATTLGYSREVLASNSRAAVARAKHREGKA